MNRNKIIWLTGLPCSGKTTIANKLASQINAEVLDGDDIRVLMNNKDFSLDGRKKHMLMVAELAYRFSKYTSVIVALVSPIDYIRKEITKKYSNVSIVFINAPIKTCINRDVKGMYKRAINGELKNFTGIDAKYESPDNCLSINTKFETVEQSVKKIKYKYFPHEVYSLFIGRWQCLPPHNGHLALFDVVRKEGKKILIGVRDTKIDKNNPYTLRERINSIQESVPDAKIIVIPDIDSVCYGRGVGYDIRQIDLPKDIENISATKIRGKLCYM